MPLHVPAASYRLAVATRYWHAARIVIGAQIRPVEYMEPVGHLLSMAAELALKAFLANAGLSDRELKQRRIGHDLGACLELAIGKGLELSEQEAQCVLVMRTAHLEHFHRYGPEGSAFGNFTIVLAKEDLALPSVARLIDLVGNDPALLRRQHQREENLDWPLTMPPLHPVNPERLSEMAKAAQVYADKTASIGAPHRDPLEPKGRSRSGR